MTLLPHDPQYTAGFYDRCGEREWDRHDATAAARVSFALHRHYLAQFVRPGDLVLDAGAGPGRFTIELAKLGARVHVGDLSPRQLELNAARVQAAGCEDAVVARTRLDICDLSRFPSGVFDAVVCYGGPLSYVLNRADDAVAELVRVVRPAGHVLLSVMSLLDGTRAFLPGILTVGRALGSEWNDTVFATGDLPRNINGHECHMYRWSELADLLGRHGEIVAASASNFLSLQNEPAFEEAGEAQREQVLRWELTACREPGLIDAGTHILAVLRKQDGA